MKCDMENYSALKIVGNSVIWDDVDEPRGHYAKRNKLDMERQILCDLTYM